jgi:hypothetical protein
MEVSNRELWLRLYAGMAMQALIRNPDFKPGAELDRQVACRHAIAMARELADAVESEFDFINTLPEALF